MKSVQSIRNLHIDGTYGKGWLICKEQY